MILALHSDQILSKSGRGLSEFIMFKLSCIQANLQINSTSPRQSYMVIWLFVLGHFDVTRTLHAVSEAGRSVRKRQGTHKRRNAQKESHSEHSRSQTPEGSGHREDERAPGPARAAGLGLASPATASVTIDKIQIVN